MSNVERAPKTPRSAETIAEPEHAPHTIEDSHITKVLDKCSPNVICPTTPPPPPPTHK